MRVVGAFEVDYPLLGLELMGLDFEVGAAYLAMTGERRSRLINLMNKKFHNILGLQWTIWEMDLHHS